MLPGEYPTRTEFTEIEKTAIDRYAKAFLDEDVIPELDVPDETKNWHRALLVPTIEKVFEGTNPLESYYSILQRNMSEIPAGDNSGISTVVFEGNWDDKFIVLESPTEVPEEYTPYQL